MSSEVSAFMVSLITLDRFLVLCFPFRQIRFKHRSAIVACLTAWSLGALIALFPLLPLANDWKFYQASSICIPLPVTRHEFPGSKYSFGVLIVLNFALFLFIAVGQIAIFVVVKVSSMKRASGGSKGQSSDLVLVYRLLAVVVTDFLCWFPIGVLGLMTANGISVPGEVNVAMAIFVLPLNAALNPQLGPGETGS